MTNDTTISGNGKPRRKRERPTQTSEISAHGETDRTDEVIVIGDSQPIASTPTIKARTNLLNIAFLAALGGGIVAELLFQSLAGAISASGAMIAYFAFGLATEKSARNTERFADSLYYLGFILTLAALFFAMVPAISGARSISSQVIIEKFGIGIATTFIGMTLRIILIQLRPTVSDQEEEARESIASYVTQLNSQITGAIRDIQKFRDIAIVSTSETARKLTQELSVLSQSSKEAVEASNSAINQSVSDIVKQMNSSIEEVLNRLKRLDIPENVLSERLEAAAISLSRDIENLRTSLHSSSNSFSEALQSSVGTMAKINSDITGLHQVISAASANVAEAAGVSKQLVDGTKEFAAGAADASTSMQRFKDTATALAQILTDVNSNLENRAKSLEGDVSAFSSTLTNSANALRDAIRDVERIA